MGNGQGKASRRLIKAQEYCTKEMYQNEQETGYSISAIIDTDCVANKLGLNAN